MKKYIILFVILLGNTLLQAQPLVISSPINRSVYQRSSNTATATATVTFSGQVSEGVNLLNQLKNDSRIEIERVTHQGNIVGDQMASRAFTSTEKTRIGTSRGFTFYLTRSMPTGWYQLNVKNGANSIVTSVMFGVGEVFIIAGQSNAQGYGNGVQSIQNISTFDCVGSFKNIQASDPGDGGYGIVNDIMNLERPTFGPLNNSNPNIGPNATRAWYYQSLGNQIANMHGTANTTVTNSTYTTYPPVPVMFFNVALAGSGIRNWKGAALKTEGMFSSSASTPYTVNYSNPLTVSYGPQVPSPYLNPSSPSPVQYPHNHPWGTPYNTQTYSTLFTNLKNMLSFYGGMYGIRAVLWHQGEAETKTQNTITYGTLYYANTGLPPLNYTITDYDTELKSIIDISRNIMPGLNWGISKASLIAEIKNGAFEDNKVSADLVQEQINLVTNNSSFIGWFTQTSDNWTYPNYRNAGDHTHFNEAGLVQMANNAYANITGTILTLTPISPVPIPKLNISKNGTANYTVSITAPSGVSYVRRDWVSASNHSTQKHNQVMANLVQNFSLTNSVSFPLPYGLCTGFTKDSQGRISIIPYVDINITGARIASRELPSIAYPNPINNGSDLKLEYEAEEEGIAVIEVYDERGKVLHSTESTVVNTGKQVSTIPFGVFKDLVDSEYLHVRIRTANTIVQKKIMIQK